MSGEAAAPGPSAPAAPASPPASAPTPAAPADRGPPPRGHKWADPPKSAPAPAGKVPIPSTPQVAEAPSRAASAPRTPQEVSTGTKAPPKPQAGLPVGKQPETGAQRQARLEKLRTADGQEVEADVSELLERYRSTEKVKVKVNGQEREVTLKEALERFPLAEGAHQRFREAHAKEEQAKQTIARLEKGLAPLGDAKTAVQVLEKIHGRDAAIQMMEQALLAHYERQKLPPEQRKALEMREEGERALSERERALVQREEAFKAQQAAESKARYEAKFKEHTEHIQRTFPVLLKNAGLPVTERTMARLAQAKGEALALKIPYTDEQIAAQVAAEMRAEVGHFAESADPEALIQALGKGAERVREAQVAKVMAQPGRGRPQVAKPGKPPDTIKTPDQLKRWLHQRDLEMERRGGR